MNKFLWHSIKTPTGFRTMSGLTFLVLLSAQFAFSQGAVKAAEEESLKLNGEYLFSYLIDPKNVAIAPLRWDKNQWLGFTGFIDGTVLIYTQDEPITDFFQRNRTVTKDKLTKYVFDPLGSCYLIPICGSVYLYGLATKNPEAETTALTTAKAIAISAAYSLVFKNIFQRKWPYDADPPDAGYWGVPLNRFHYNAFPSGHPTVAFAAATAISTYYKDKI